MMQGVHEPRFHCICFAFLQHIPDIHLDSAVYNKTECATEIYVYSVCLYIYVEVHTHTHKHTETAHIISITSIFYCESARQDSTYHHSDIKIHLYRTLKICTLLPHFSDVCLWCTFHHHMFYEHRNNFNLPLNDQYWSPPSLLPIL
jgi:hypothetical protein